ncbi:MAG: lipoyl domain-containing protein [Pseudomonadota bacterium]
MSLIIKAPDLGDGVTHAMVGAWHAKPGDTVSEGALIVDVATDKAAFEVTAPGSGVLVEIFVEPDQEFEAGAALGRIETL